MSKGKSYDPACYDLAQLFLDGVPLAGDKQCDELAAAIQQAVEDYIFNFEAVAKVAEEEAAEEKFNNGQFGVGA